jgi:hypothetical protein
VGRLNFEALREEEHRFDENNHTRTIVIRQRLCCTAAMRLPQQFAGHELKRRYACKFGIPRAILPMVLLAALRSDEVPGPVRRDDLSVWVAPQKMCACE